MSSESFWVTAVRPRSSWFGQASTAPSGWNDEPPTNSPVWHTMQPALVKTRRPSTSSAVSAALSPPRNASHRAGVTRPRSKAPMAWPTLPSVMGLAWSGNAAANAVR